MKKKRTLRLATFTVAFGTLCLLDSQVGKSTDSSQNQISNISLFHRCYTALTRTKVTSQHPLWQSVENGTLDPVDACMSVLSSASLNSSGNQEGSLKEITPESSSILRTFNDFHRTWFPNDSISNSHPSQDCLGNTARLYDESEAALHVTRALLGEKVQYSEIVTGSDSLEAMRTNGPGVIDNLESVVTPGRPNLGTVQSSYIGNQTGTLYGIRPLRLNGNRFQQQINAIGSQTPVSIHESQGGGILGTSSYLILNLGRPNRNPADGGLYQSRRWSKAILSDFLCRDVPTIRVADAIPYVTRTMASNSPPFRGSPNCMACHATMDQMASVSRNIAYEVSSSFGCMSGHNYASLIRKIPTTDSREAGLVNADPRFAFRPPNGRFYFRTYDGKLIAEDIQGIAGLGNVLANTNDLYVCAASRYFWYFTGIRVNLQDIQDPDQQPLSSQDLDYRNQVIQMGLNLKQHQSLKNLIREIFSSSTYRRVSMRNWGIQD